MAGVVKPHRGEAGPFQRLAEGAVEGAWVNRVAISPAKHQAMICVALPEHQPLLSLLSPVVSESGQAEIWQRDGPPGMLRLGLLKHQAGPAYRVMLHPYKSLPNVHDLALPIDILPPEPGHLRTPQPCHEEEEEGHMQAMPLERWQQFGGHLFDGHGASFLALKPWWLRKLGHIPHHQVMLFRQRERMRQGDMIEPNGCGFQPVLHVLVIEVLHVLGP
jgi:hypothetical protein